jgi:hypothetical protein
MALIASPYGLRPVQLQGGLPFAGATRSYPLLTNSATAIFFGDPVGLVGGQIVAVAASPTVTLSANSPIGIFMGCEYQDPVRGFVNSQMLPANLITGGAKSVKCKIADNPDLIMKVQSSGSVAATAIGLNAALVVGAGNVATGDSTFAAGAAAATTGIALRIVGFLDMPGSTPGDAFTDLLVQWNIGVHRTKNPLGQ